MNYTFEATALARAWLSVALGASTNAKDPPFIYRAVAIEAFDTGVRLVATDRSMVLTSWVPAIDLDVARSLPPTFDEAPKETIIAMDTGARAAGLLGYALELGADEERAEPLQLGLSVGPAPEPETGALAMPGMDRDTLGLEVPGREMVRIDLYEGDWPDWRPLLYRFAAKRTTGIALAPAMMGRLAKLKAWQPETPLVCEFGGSNKPIRVRIGDALFGVDGVVLPARWAFDVDDLTEGDE